MSITYSECVPVALIIQHVIHVRHIAIGDLVGSTISTLSHKLHEFEKKFFAIKCVF